VYIPFWQGWGVAPPTRSFPRVERDARCFTSHSKTEVTTALKLFPGDNICYLRDGKDMSKPQLNTRVPENVKAEIERYAEKHDISQADAARQLMILGLQNQSDFESALAAPTQENQTLSGSVLNNLAKTVYILGLTAVLTFLPPFAGAPGWFHSVFAVSTVAGVLVAVAYLIIILGTSARPSSPVLFYIIDRFRGVYQ